MRLLEIAYTIDMELLKKNWWIIAIILVLLYLWYSSEKSKSEGEASGCKKISKKEWDEKKLAAFNGYQDWNLAHLYMLNQGYCEQLDD